MPTIPSEDRRLGRLTYAEQTVIQKLAELWADIQGLVPPGPTREADLAELIVPIHTLQRAVMAQSAGRAYPDFYRLLGSTLEEAFLAPDTCEEPSCSLERWEGQTRCLAHLSETGCLITGCQETRLLFENFCHAHLQEAQEIQAERAGSPIEDLSAPTCVWEVAVGDGPIELCGALTYRDTVYCSTHGTVAIRDHGATHAELISGEGQAVRRETAVAADRICAVPACLGIAWTGSTLCRAHEEAWRSSREAPASEGPADHLDDQDPVEAPNGPGEDRL